MSNSNSINKEAFLAKEREKIIGETKTLGYNEPSKIKIFSKSSFLENSIFLLSFGFP